MENRTIKLSIMCTAYNHEKYIRQTLEGFVSQRTDFDFEAIVHDDASTDGTAAIIQEYAEKYPDIIKPIFQTVNQYSRKVNIDRDILKPKAKGVYIAYCEGDDYWTDPHKLQKQVDLLDHNPEYSATTHNCYFIDEDGNEIKSIYPMYRHCCDHRYTLKRFSRDVVYPGQTASLVYRKSAYDFDSPEQEEDFYRMRVTTGDKRTFLKLLMAGDIYCFEERMSAYRIVTQRGDSWSAANYGKNLSFLLHIASIDFRKYVRKYTGKPFLNYYTTFHTGIAGIAKAIIEPNAQNKDVSNKIFQEHNGVLGTVVYLVWLGVVSIPLYFIREAERTRFDVEE